MEEKVPTATSNVKSDQAGPSRATVNRQPNRSLPGRGRGGLDAGRGGSNKRTYYNRNNSSPNYYSGYDNRRYPEFRRDRHNSAPYTLRGGERGGRGRGDGRGGGNTCNSLPVNPRSTILQRLILCV